MCDQHKWTKSEQQEAAQEAVGGNDEDLLEADQGRLYEEFFDDTEQEGATKTKTSQLPFDYYEKALQEDVGAAEAQVAAKVT